MRRKKSLKNFKKANAILEYTILLSIVVFAFSGITQYGERVIKGYVKKVNDSELKKPIPFLWQGALIVSKEEYNSNRIETYNGNIVDISTSSGSSLSLQAPTPPYIDVAGLHTQDPPDSVGDGGQRRRNPGPIRRLIRFFLPYI